MTVIKRHAVPLAVLAAIVVVFMLAPKREPITLNGELETMADIVIEDVRSENERLEALYRWSHDSLASAIQVFQDSIRVMPAGSSGSSDQLTRVERNQQLILRRLDQFAVEVGIMKSRQLLELCREMPNLRVCG